MKYFILFVLLINKHLIHQIIQQLFIEMNTTLINYEAKG